MPTCDLHSTALATTHMHLTTTPADGTPHTTLFTLHLCYHCTECLSQIPRTTAQDLLQAIITLGETHPPTPNPEGGD